MTQSDELLTKADALLARWRSGAVVPRPPADFPVLTEIVKVPAAHHDVPPPDIPSGAEIPAPESSEAPTLAAPPAAADAVPAALDAADDLPDLPSNEDTPARADTAVQELEERVRLRVLDAIEPYVSAFLEEPLRLRMEELARDLATNIARDARYDILALVRDAVRSAVAHEFQERRDE